ncbi:MAG TPA: hypothetical protein VJT49_15965 [Amycolatopsis sp.]|uniref:hypothetical protein n=1 Tax=Amycolatopsis sp. TaxID=37632 RepID=UPI002B496DE9|nr:hypothetical protein [Amycolatopsis sp.]HKS46575.1 hypothetical protein [Amycolatopsis sp.]
METVRATGAGKLRVLLGHGPRNAAMPAVTVVGLLVGSVLGGSVVVETVFSARAGPGRLLRGEHSCRRTREGAQPCTGECAQFLTQGPR